MRTLLLCLLCTLTYAADLPVDAAKLVEVFDADAAKLRADTEKAIDKKAAVLANALQVVQEKLTKKGDLDGALAVKSKIVALGAKTEAPATSVSLKQRLVGLFDYSFQNGHKGQLQVRSSEVTEVLTGIQGSLRVVNEASAVIEWSNNTQWKLTAKDGALTLLASDGAGTLVEAKKP